MPGFPSNSGAGFYNPGGIENEYEKLQKQPGLPGVNAPANVGQGPSAAAFASHTPLDPNAPDILDLIKGGKFKPPFTVTLQKRDGIATFKSDAGVKKEANYALCKETIRTPADLLRIRTGIVAEIYKPLNNMSLEFQLMLYLAYKNGSLDVPPPPEPAPTTTEVEVAKEAETTAEATAEA